MKKPIAVWVISNTASLNVWEHDENADSLLVGVNNDEPEWVKIDHQVDPDSEEFDTVTFIDFHGTVWRLDECMRVG